MILIIQRLLFIALLFLSCGVGVVFFVAHNKCVDFSVLEQYHVGKPSLLLDDEGNEWARFQLDRRDPIKLEQMPQRLINAFLAAEDWRFFEHSGISWKGIIRSTLVNLYRGGKVQGASTITQQLVRLLFLDAQKTFSRKIKEQLVAVLVECQFSKEQILETYLNYVYFGCGIYGVEAASQCFWGKHAWEISVDEAAVLAAIMRSPNKYCPLININAAQKRRDIVLQSMYKLQFITAQEYDAAKAITLTIKESDDAPCAPHLKESLRIQLEELVGKTRLYGDGLVIQTTLNRSAQDKAQQAFNAQFKKLREGPLPGIDGALLSIDVKTGDIKALVGGVNFRTSKWNRAFQARRQMGSTFKPLVYAAAMQAGMNFADTEIDEPLEFTLPHGVWRPNNAFLKFDGQMTLAWALSTSNNIISIKTLLKVGAENVIALSKKCHIQSQCSPYPSLALGCVDATVQEVAGIFNIFANDGNYVAPHALSWIKDRSGTKIWRHQEINERVISSRICGQVSKVLELSLRRVRSLFNEPWVESDVISKTGTTNDFRTCWFAGSTPELTTVIYIGRDDNKPIGYQMFPLKTAFPIWLELNRQVPVMQKNFIYDPSLQPVSINPISGKLSSREDQAITILV